MRYPKEWLGFIDLNTDEIFEVVDVDDPPRLPGDFYVRHIYDCHRCKRGDFAVARLRDLSPLTPAAREFAKIAKAGK